jgi:hypothetical protein
VTGISQLPPSDPVALAALRAKIRATLAANGIALEAHDEHDTADE